MAFKRKLIDIGANLTDSMFLGIYNGKKCHQPDLTNVLERARRAGLDKIIVTGGNLDESEKAIELSKSDSMLYATVGCHPTRCLELEDDTDNYINSLLELCRRNPEKVVAIGEFGLDYDRLNFCPKDVQHKNFLRQFELADQTRLPLFLHCRNAAQDLLDVLKSNRDRFGRGVVHSFDGTFEEAKSFIDLGLLIGLNGCSLKTENNLEVVRKLPVESILIETDSPWCDIRASHASYKFVQTQVDSVKKEKWNETLQVKSRNEPANIVQVLEVVSQLKDTDMDQLAEDVYRNTSNLFFPTN